MKTQAKIEEKTDGPRALERIVSQPSKKPDCYVGRKDCGCLVAVVFDEPKYRKDTAKSVADFVRNGYRVESAVWDEVRDQLKRCKCEHGQACDKVKL